MIPTYLTKGSCMYTLELVFGIRTNHSLGFQSATAAVYTVAGCITLLASNMPGISISLWIMTMTLKTPIPNQKLTRRSIPCIAVVLCVLGSWRVFDTSLRRAGALALRELWQFRESAAILEACHVVWYQDVPSRLESQKVMTSVLKPAAAWCVSVWILCIRTA